MSHKTCEQHETLRTQIPTSHIKKRINRPARVSGIELIFVEAIYDYIRSKTGNSIEWCALTAIEVLCNYDPNKRKEP